MILHLTLGSTHIPIEINVDGPEPQLSVLQGQVATLPSVLPPRARRRTILPKLMLVGVAVVCGLTAYQVSTSRSGPTLTAPQPARAELSRGSSGPASADVDQIPPQLRREMAGRPIVTPAAPAAPAEVGAKPVGGNPFGLD